MFGLITNTCGFIYMYIKLDTIYDKTCKLETELATF